MEFENRKQEVNQVFNTSDFIGYLFKIPTPGEPFSVDIGIESGFSNVKEFLQYLLVNGTYTRFAKELAVLDETEMKEIHDIMRMIGWDFTFDKEVVEKEIDGKKEMVNHFKIDFYPLPHNLRPNVNGVL